MLLGSVVAVAAVQASSCSSNSTPSLGTSICHRGGPKKQKLKKKKNKGKITRTQLPGLPSEAESHSLDHAAADGQFFVARTLLSSESFASSLVTCWRETFPMGYKNV